MSYTLMMHDAAPQTACAGCDKAVWQSFCTEEADDVIPFKALEKGVKIACWCTLMHCYIQTPRKYCDGNIPMEEPDIDDYITDKS